MNKTFNYALFLTISLILLIVLNTFFLIPELLNYVLIALGLGLRHGLDADHIIAIDNITRKLVAEKKRAQSTGLFFALGHSTIVFLLTLMLVIGFSHAQGLYTNFREIGDKIGYLVSISFLIFTLILNLSLLKSFNDSSTTKKTNRSLIYRVIHRYLFQTIDRPEKMYIVGFFFGLGFDTATEIGLLSLTAISLLHGFSVIFILLLPLSFAGGMIITDTINSNFMANLYIQANRSPHKLKLYNYLILSFASLATVFVISIEGLNYLRQSTVMTHVVAQTMNRLANNSDIVGATIITTFIILSIFLSRNPLSSPKFTGRVE